MIREELTDCFYITENNIIVPYRIIIRLIDSGSGLISLKIHTHVRHSGHLQ